ncbi:hypothetical protein L1987_78699 [Smallanthus sonchifolius]|uniref:Uncharacterized protein n=1 Tax=Smallanthus sonchifolius TaxID=185202 RepID=A0ACB8ZEH4_9ASTR|nr:hypothetical protein L1987_78699 [Smallanthus sonchifolius]
MSRSNNQWLQFHENNQTPTTVQTDATTTPNTAATNQLNRVTRPTIARRRSRASRKTQTTLLNTDTTNFRAMVQRFTGGGNNVTSVPFLSHVTSTHQEVLNTSSSSSFNDGVGRISYESYNRPLYNQPYFTMVGDDGGTTSVHDDGGDDDDQHTGFRQTGSFNW